MFKENSFKGLNQRNNLCVEEIGSTDQQGNCVLGQNNLVQNFVHTSGCTFGMLPIVLRRKNSTRLSAIIRCGR